MLLRTFFKWTTSYSLCATNAQFFWSECSWLCSYCHWYWSSLWQLCVWSMGRTFSQNIWSARSQYHTRYFSIEILLKFKGFLYTLSGVWTNLYVILAIAFVYMSLLPMLRVCRESIWQQKVPPALLVTYRYYDDY